jgi:hypothetical protein
VSPQAPGIMVLTRWLGTHGLETSASEAPKRSAADYEVSADGRTLTG